uniref:RING-CH-type domain-containing protein n=1 Tax=Nicotiana tabacum TaxID=4097 RepID=A0A1S4CM34_TOBAC|nr:uncharacterized protein LOC104090834 [Nicotiana tomentosiformis]XP_016502195.1 PREDICTED: uncharacterized protein LOC107820423 [Nicotiana tabacum]
MARVELSHVDLECSGHSRRSSVSVNISDADNVSCYSQFYSTADARANESDNSVDIENGYGESKLKIERDCRICHLSLVSECGIAIELGCSCKDDLATAHEHCAETWFKIKGNKRGAFA